MSSTPTRVYRPDLSEHYLLVHPKRQWGIIKFRGQKTEAWLQKYWFDDDGDLHVGKKTWVPVHKGPKGPYVERQRKKAYLHDFIKALPNPYA